MGQRTKLWYLKNVNLFHGISDEQMRMIEERTVMREIRRKEVLYLPGDAGDRIYLLKRGSSRSRRSPTTARRSSSR